MVWGESDDGPRRKAVHVYARVDTGWVLEQVLMPIDRAIIDHLHRGTLQATSDRIVMLTEREATGRLGKETDVALYVFDLEDEEFAQTAILEFPYRENQRVAPGFRRFDLDVGGQFVLVASFSGLTAFREHGGRWLRTTFARAPRENMTSMLEVEGDNLLWWAREVDQGSELFLYRRGESGWEPDQAFSFAPPESVTLTRYFWPGLGDDVVVAIVHGTTGPDQLYSDARLYVRTDDGWSLKASLKPDWIHAVPQRTSGLLDVEGRTAAIHGLDGEEHFVYRYDLSPAALDELGKTDRP